MKKTYDKSNASKIPYDQLSPRTLESVIEEFVTRDGTDYGEMDVPLQRKVDQVKRHLKSGQAIILFDESTQTCNIVSKDDPLVKELLK
ncbi:MAG: YheU family protein [Deltaproteobacteria bacterium]|nr:YheU family protein [Deltaproteobacteria bacterium]